MASILFITSIHICNIWAIAHIWAIWLCSPRVRSLSPLSVPAAAEGPVTRHAPHVHVHLRPLPEITSPPPLPPRHRISSSIPRFIYKSKPLTVDYYSDCTRCDDDAGGARANPEVGKRVKLRSAERCDTSLASRNLVTARGWGTNRLLTGWRNKNRPRVG